MSTEEPGMPGRQESIRAEVSRISVIVPCYNEERHIGQCLASLKRQTLPAFEIIVIDDGSTDSTREVVRSFGVTLLQQQHQGPAAARNLGATTARGEIMVLADADMFFDEQYLERLTQPIREGRSVGTFSKDEFVGNPENTWAVCWNLEAVSSRNRRVREDSPDEATLYRALIRRRFIDAGGYETRVGYEDDTTLYPKLGAKAINVPGAISYHNNPGSIAEIYRSARWIGRSIRYAERPSRLLYYSFPFSIFFGIIKSIRYHMPVYFIFKIIYDWSLLSGGISRLLFNKHAK